MNYNEKILVKEGELFLKKGNRKVFEKHLLNNIRKKLESCSYKIKLNQGVVEITPENRTNMAIILSKLDKIFGIATYCQTFCCEPDLESLVKQIEEKLKLELQKAKTFRIRAKRSNKKFKLNSMQVERILGDRIKQKNPQLEVDLSNESELTIHVEITQENFYFYSKIYKGAGGLPVGSNGKAMLLLSGGIDSPVAGWMMAKRGLQIEAVHFQSPPYTSDKAIKKIEKLVKVLEEWTGKIKLHVINISAEQEEIKKNCKEKHLTIHIKKIMLKKAEELTKTINLKSNKKIETLITGDSLGQVFSQTLNAIKETLNSIDTPVLQPLIGFDKNEIVELSKKLNLFNISVIPLNDCCTAIENT